jgi:LexA-binding, inner membrane-associated putative hydrolase
MANRKTHVAVGVAAGFAVTVFNMNRCDERGNLQTLLKLLGGALGGYLGGMLPDRLEPPTNPRHRAGLHSKEMACSLIATTTGLWQFAQDLELQAIEEDSALKMLASGALVGVISGYLTHLALDARTPAGLPGIIL